MKHNELRVWNLAMELAEQVYSFSSELPDRERYGLTSQMRRAAISIPSNLAEGAARSSTKELIHFLDIAIGSASELETQFILAQRLWERAVGFELSKVQKVKTLLVNLRRSLRKKG